MLCMNQAVGQCRKRLASIDHCSEEANSFHDCLIALNMLYSMYVPLLMRQPVDWSNVIVACGEETFLSKLTMLAISQ